MRHLAMERPSCHSFVDLVHDIPGLVRVYRTSISATLPFRDGNQSVVGFVWLPSSLADMFRRCGHVEPDALFRAMKPRVYAVPLGIGANESFPLGAVVGIFESKKLYNMDFDAIQALGPAKHQSMISVLDREIPREVLFAGDHAAAGLLLDSRPSHQALPPRRQNHRRTAPASFLRIHIGLSSTGDQNCVRLLVNVGSRYSGGQWSGIWSNHIEGLHRRINRAVAGYQNPLRRLAVLIECVNAVSRNPRAYLHAQGAKPLKKHERHRRALCLDPVETCEDSMGGWGFTYTSIRCVSWFPCVHEFGTAEVE
jgi:hypothetical protein